METFIKLYAKEISKLDFLITWPINTDVRLGDVGVLEDGVFKRTDTLDNLGIDKPKVRKGRGKDVKEEYASKNGVEILLDSSVESKLKDSGGKIEIKFSREGAVFLRLYDNILSQFETTDHLGKEIIKRKLKHNWQKGRVVVTEIVTCSDATILVAGSNNATARLQLDISMPASEAIAKGKFAQVIGFTGNFGANIIGQNLSPLIRICGIKPRVFGLLGHDFKSGESVLENFKPDEIEFSRINSSYELI